jgi:Protein of unknown function (DUF1113).
MRRTCKAAALFIIGAAVYWSIEFSWRSLVGTLPVHWTMAALGGGLFLVLGNLNEHLSWEMSLTKQAVIGTAVITAAELIVGLILNVGLGLAIWDYSHLPFHFMGQISLGFCAAWFPLSIVGIMLDDWMRYWLFGEDKPHYSVF